MPTEYQFNSWLTMPPHVAGRVDSDESAHRSLPTPETGTHNDATRQKVDSASQPFRDDQLRELIALSSGVASCSSLEATGIYLASRLRAILSVQHVVLTGRWGSSPERLIGVSDVENADPTTPMAKAIGLITSTAQSGENDANGQWYVHGDADQDNSNLAATGASLAMRQYCQATGAEACGALPLTDPEGNRFGTIILAVDAKSARDPHLRRQAETLSGLVASQLWLSMQAHRTVWRIFRERVGRAVSGRRAHLFAAIAAGLTLLMLLPWPYRVAAECQVQLVQRRFVSAPFDAVLQRTLVESGDVVDKDQVLAVLDDRHLRIELASKQAQLSGYQKQREAALARGDIALSQLTQLDIQRLEAEIQLVQSRLENLVIRSPLQGIVISGDLEKVEGAPVTMGQTLFEIGPLGAVVMEISIPESEIQHVSLEMPVQVTLDAFPLRRWSGKLLRIHPRAEIVNDNSVFVAEVQMDNPDGLLRPGMKGRARITTGNAPLGWNLFHKPWNRVREVIIW